MESFLLYGNAPHNDKIRRHARSTSENITNAFHDDFVKKNAEFRNDAGMKSYLNRQTDGSCCKWCTKIAGRYDYGKAPEDIFRRHDNCTCIVTFESGRFRQDVWSKKSWEEAPKGVKIKKPTVLSQEQGQAIEDSIMSQYMGIDNSGETMIMESRFTENIDDFNNGQKDIIKHRNIELELEKSEIGKEYKQYLIDNPCKVNIYYNVDVDGTHLGEYDGFTDNISLFGSNTKTVARTSEVLIHELTHRRYNIGGDYWSECVCRAHEIMHRERRNFLTIAEKRSIIKEIKKVYGELHPDWKWRRRL